MDFFLHPVMIGGYIGFGLGWLLFKRPEWIERAFSWIKSKTIG